jgi:NAD(P)-dependent dehydrogenase (short-subunit alcohol dehydrogenase family)
LILSGRPDPSTPLRAVVNLAGISPRKSIEDYTLAYVDALLPVNVKGPIFVTQAFLPGLRKRAGGGVVVQHRPR